MLESLRRRRRLIIATSVILIAAPSTFLGAHHTTSGSTRNADRAHVRDSFYREQRGHLASSARRVAQPQDAGSSQGRVRLDTAWLLVPLGVMALVMLIPIGLGISLWIRYRRAEAAYIRDRKALGDQAP